MRSWLKLQTDRSEGSLRSLFGYLHQGRQHIKISVYSDTDGKQLIWPSQSFTFLYTTPNVQLSRYDDPSEHPFDFHGLKSRSDRAYIVFYLLT